jgi:undecaprenol kinase
MTKLVSSIRVALNGIKTVYREERNFKIELFLGLLSMILGLVLEINLTEMIFIIICVIFVLAAEIVNTAIEDLCDKVEPDQNKIIGKIKDTMAGFVLISSIGSIAIACMIFLPKIYFLLNN